MRPQGWYAPAERVLEFGKPFAMNPVAAATRQLSPALEQW